MGSFVLLENVSKCYGDAKNPTYALKDVNLEIKDGEFFGIMGESGAGKSTLLKLLATLDVPTGGKLYLNGKSARGMYDGELSEFRKNNVGFIFQSYNLLDTLTLRENIKVPLTLRNVPKEEAEERIAIYSKKMNISNLLDKYPSECSGGECQRAAACRAIVSKAKFIVADEPTGALDSKNSKELMSILRTLNEEEGLGIIMVTHSSYIGSYCDNLAIVKDGCVSETLTRGNDSQYDFYNRISDAIAKEKEALF
ncbi:MAG: ABC transporter ATP-binding protein [Sarcina sp.]